MSSQISDPASSPSVSLILTAPRTDAGVVSLHLVLLCILETKDVMPKQGVCLYLSCQFTCHAPPASPAVLIDSNSQLYGALQNKSQNGSGSWHTVAELKRLVETCFIAVTYFPYKCNLIRITHCCRFPLFVGNIKVWMYNY